MPFESQDRIIADHPVPIIDHAHQTATAEFDLYLIRRAPASMLFSTSSLITDAGRSTTSPAAIWFARLSGKMLILFIYK